MMNFELKREIDQTKVFIANDNIPGAWEPEELKHRVIWYTALGSFFTTAVSAQLTTADQYTETFSNLLLECGIVIGLEEHLIQSTMNQPILQGVKKIMQQLIPGFSTKHL